MSSLFFRREPVVGDYVLATKWHDGDPGDHFAVGWVDGIDPRGRYDIVDDQGKPFRGNGFRRCQPISNYAGRFILENAKTIEFSGKSVWWWLYNMRQISGHPTT